MADVNVTPIFNGIIAASIGAAANTIDVGLNVELTGSGAVAH